MNGVVLNSRRALTVAILAWLVNQAIRFDLRGYPLSVTAFTWGALMGMGALLVVDFAIIRTGLSQSS
ncbi:MAG: hypothetical protein AAGG51_07800 [Cyanobacteria bacterium P01_G01_bin.54]